MDHLQVGSFQAMKLLNQSTVLNLIRQSGPISRSELAKLTKLTPATMTNIVGELLDSRLVIESDLGQSSGGRKPIMLKLNGSSFCVIGVYAGSRRINAIAAALDGRICAETELQAPAAPGRSEFLAGLRRAIDEVMRKLPTQRRVLGIGVGMHGLVDPQQGRSIYAPHLNLRDIPVKADLQGRYSLPVEVENDVRALSLGESWYGQGQGIANFICVNSGTGVGAGIILDHKLYHGTSFTAGEMGHSTIDLEGPLCSCGNYGCLEAFVGSPAVVRRFKDRVQSGAASSLGKEEQQLDHLTVEMIQLAAAKGDSVAAGVLHETGRYLGAGIANLVNTLNPSRIIVSGGVAGRSSHVFDTLRQEARRRALTASAAAVSIVQSGLGANANAIGAFTLILQKLFEGNIVELAKR
ncbi:MAG: transcriptional regulator/sugar kinase [Bacilli bacterium]|nr:transcriptional regulator/sugar kinase [Bacilli bacterium]